jgi:NADH:ubiquinone oxidoreductase subunit K
MNHSAYGIPIWWFLTLGVILFCIGLFGVMTRRSAIAILLSIELMLNAANINLVAFGAYLRQTAALDQVVGQVFAIFVMTLAAAEVAVGIAIVINIYRLEQHIDADKVTAMKM